MHMLLNSRGNDPIIEEIWSWEAVNHGDSALVNEQNLGAFCEDPSSNSLILTNPSCAGYR